MKLHLKLFFASVALPVVFPFYEIWVPTLIYAAGDRPALNLPTLPEDVQDLILKGLDAKSVCSVSMVCKQLRRASKSLEVAYDQFEKYESCHESVLRAAAIENRTDILQYFFAIHPPKLARIIAKKSGAFQRALEGGHLEFARILSDHLFADRADRERAIQLIQFVGEVCRRQNFWLKNSDLMFFAISTNTDLAKMLIPFLSGHELVQKHPNDAGNSYIDLVIEKGHDEIASAMIRRLGTSEIIQGSIWKASPLVQAIRFKRDRMFGEMMLRIGNQFSHGQNRDAFAEALREAAEIRNNYAVTRLVSSIDSQEITEAPLGNSEIGDADLIINPKLIPELLELQDKRGNTILYYAILGKNTPLVLALLPHMADENLSNMEYLRLAIQWGCIDIVKGFIARLGHEVVFSVDNQGATLLHHALKHGQTEVALALILVLSPDEIKKIRKLETIYGHTPLDLAKSTSTAVIKKLNAGSHWWQ